MNKILLASLLLVSVSSFASNSKDFTYTVEPIVGYETVFRPFPTPHTSTRMVYGARVIAGVPLLSGEIEYTKGQDTEDYLVAPEKIVNYDEKLKLGIRSTYNFNKYMFTSFRLGGQASKNTEEVTNTGIVTKTEHDIKYDPYAGANLGIKISRIISISAGVTAVFNDISDMGKNDYQYSLAIGIGR